MKTKQFSRLWGISTLINKTKPRKVESNGKKKTQVDKKAIRCGVWVHAYLNHSGSSSDPGPPRVGAKEARLDESRSGARRAGNSYQRARAVRDQFRSYRGNLLKEHWSRVTGPPPSRVPRYPSGAEWIRVPRDRLDKKGFKGPTGMCLMMERRTGPWWRRCSDTGGVCDHYLGRRGFRVRQQTQWPRRQWLTACSGEADSSHRAKDCVRDSLKSARCSSWMGRKLRYHVSWLGQSDTLTGTALFDGLSLRLPALTAFFVHCARIGFELCSSGLAQA